MQNYPSIAIVILNWNNYPDTKKCLDSLSKLTYQNTKVILVDNGSQDGSNRLLKEEYPDITVLESAKNIGFAGGNNLAIKHALENDCQYILLLNNDTEVIEENFLTKLVEEFQNNSHIGAVGPKVLQGDGHTESTILPYPSLGHTIWNTLGMYVPNLEQRKSVDSVTGCCVLVRSEALERVGLLDENYFMYAEETEWFYRMRNAGWKVIFLPVESIVHKGGASSMKLENQAVYIERRANVVYTLVKHQQKIQAAFTIIFMLILLSLRILASVFRTNQNERLPISMVLDLITTFHLKWNLAASTRTIRGKKHADQQEIT
ncbi:MAG: glycosyltransferase family 2 protein [Anaerolineales bacterium]|nr:glycosyltransferase family 2 protein [Anaerolineales bacterium]